MKVNTLGMGPEKVIETLKFAANKLAEDAKTIQRSHQIVGSTEWDCEEAKREFQDNSTHSFRLFQIVRHLRQQMPQ